MVDRQYDGTDNAFVYDGEPTTSLPEDVARVVERLEYERDVWHSKSTMHQKDATAARADRDRLAAENERLRDALDDMLFEYGDKYDSECRLKNSSELDMIGKARTALAGKAGEA